MKKLKLPLIYLATFVTFAFLSSFLASHFIKSIHIPSSDLNTQIPNTPSSPLPKDTRIVNGREIKLLNNFAIFELIDNQKKFPGSGLSKIGQKWIIHGYAKFTTKNGKAYLDLYDHNGIGPIPPVSINWDSTKKIPVGFVGKDRQLNLSQPLPVTKDILSSQLEIQILNKQILVVVDKNDSIVNPTAIYYFP